MFLTTPAIMSKYATHKWAAQKARGKKDFWADSREFWKRTGGEKVNYTESIEDWGFLCENTEMQEIYT